MRYRFSWFPSAVGASAALRGGGAAAGWCRGLAHESAKLALLRRGGAWVAAETGAVHPRLCSGPLMGAALTSLTAPPPAPPAGADTGRPGEDRSVWREISPPPERQTKAAGERAGPPPHPPTAVRRLAAERGEPKAAPAGGSTGPRPGLQTQADRSLLDRLAGRRAAPAGAGQRSASEQNKRRSLPLKAETKGGKAGPQAAVRDPAAHPGWRSRLAERAESVLNRVQPDAAQGPPPAGDGAPAAGRTQTVADPWSMPLDGPGASSDLLNRLARGRLPDSAERNRPQRGPSSQAKAPSTEAFGALRSVRLPEESFSPSGLSGRRPPEAAQERSEPRTPEFGGSGRVPRGEDDSTFPPAVRPNVMRALPSLLAPQRAGEHPRPVAAATARHGARKEAIGAAEDLDALADAIKRILDEQARRHGIDV